MGGRFDEKIFTNILGKGEVDDSIDLKVQLESLQGTVTSGAIDALGAFDASDKLYLQAQITIQKRIENQIKAQEDEELSLFRTKSAERKIDPIHFSSKSKKLTNDIISNLKIKVKKRKLNDNQNTISNNSEKEAQQPKQIKTETKPVEIVKETEVSCKSSVMTLVSSYYDDSD